MHFCLGCEFATSMRNLDAGVSFSVPGDRHCAEAEPGSKTVPKANLAYYGGLSPLVHSLVPTASPPYRGDPVSFDTVRLPAPSKT